MKVADVKKVCVAGGGLMGRQIGLNAAIYGFETYLYDAFTPMLEKVDAWAKDYMAGRVAKGKLTQEAADAALAKFHLCETLEEAADNADVVIEAIIEKMDIKHKFFQDLDKIVRPDTIIATNSSFMVSSTFKDDVSNPGRLANFHYFNPALFLKLIEVVKGEHTDKETADFLMDFARAMGKDPIYLTKEIDGFVVNRILRALKDEASFLYEDGVASYQDIDKGVKLGLNHPMGPFELTDLTGIDMSYNSLQRRYDETGVKPVGYDTIKEMYDRGDLGRKTGKGFYTYDKK